MKLPLEHRILIFLVKRERGEIPFKTVHEEIRQLGNTKPAREAADMLSLLGLISGRNTGENWHPTATGFHLADALMKDPEYEP